MFRSSALRTAILIVAAFVLASVSPPAASASSTNLRPAVRKTVARLVFGTPNGVNNLDPDKIGSGGAYVDNLCLELLSKLGPRGQVQPSLAQSIERRGLTVYLYHLRHGVKFWDGRELTSADVVNSLDYEHTVSQNGPSVFADIKGIRATDRYTVTMTLKHPDSALPYTFTYTGYIFEKRFQDQHKTTMGQPGTLIMGTGPYIIKSFDPASGAELTANPHYWGGKPRIQHVSVRFFSTEQTMALAFRAGEIDLAFPSDPRSWVATAGSPLISMPSARQGFLSMNTKMAPFNDVHVRRAIAYAINRDNIISAEGGYAAKDFTMIPPLQLQTIASKAKVDALIRSLQTYRQNLIKAKQELSKSSYPHGFTVNFDTTQFASYPDVDQTIAREVASIRITLKVNIVSQSQYIDEYLHKGLPISYGYFNSQSPDPGYLPGITFLSSNATLGGPNYSMYTNPAVDKLIKDGQTTVNHAKRFAIYSQLLRIVAKDAPMLGLYEANNNLALSPKFSFPTFNAFTTDHTPFIMQVKVK